MIAAVLHGALPPAAGGGQARGGRGDDQGGRVQVEVYRCTGVQVYSVLSLDVYSFAIILHEIIARAGVWGGTLGPDVSRAATLFTYLHLFKFI